MSTLQRIATRVARAWVDLYTSRMPIGLRVTRRAEIDSDLWEHARDRKEGGARPLITALEILLRTCLGVVDDLSWCVEACRQERGASRKERRLAMDFSARQTRWISIFTVAGGATVILMFGLIPTLRSYFASVGIPLPLPTRIVIGMSAVLTAYWWASLAAGVALFMGLTRISRVGALPDGEVDSVKEAALAKWEPIMIVGLSVVVGGMILAMFLPIFDAVSAMR